MYTRQTVERNFGVASPERVSLPGFVKAETSGGIVQTWAIVRPMSGWSATSGSLVSDGYPDTMIIRAGTTTLQCTQPRVEMDPSDSRTWQRGYRFTS
jgi:hypothetical protein